MDWFGRYGRSRQGAEHLGLERQERCVGDRTVKEGIGRRGRSRIGKDRNGLVFENKMNGSEILKVVAVVLLDNDYCSFIIAFNRW